MNRVHRFGLLSLCILSAGVARRLDAQAPMGPRAQTSRADIETAIAEADKILASPGYSSRLKDSKRKEVALLRYRLSEGDLQQGDQIILSVQGEQLLSGTFTVGPGRTLTLPGIGDITLKGVLRAEVPEYLTSQLQKYLKEPVVHAQTTMRLSVLGAIGKPGFYQVPSEMMIGDALMAAGGPSGGVDPAKTRIQRNGEEIVSKEAFTAALNEGKTLDQLSLMAGDEILVGGDRIVKPHANVLTVIVPVFGMIASVSYLLVQIF